MTPDKLKRLAPEFASIDDATLAEFIAQARRMSADAASWGAVYSDAMCYLAAHLLALAERGNAASDTGDALAGTGAAGGVNSVTVGRWSVSVANAASAALGADATYDTTRHGKMFLALRKTRAVGRTLYYSP